MTNCGLVCVPGTPGTALATAGCWLRVDACAGMEYSCDWLVRTCAEAEGGLIAVAVE